MNSVEELGKVIGKTVDNTNINQQSLISPGEESSWLILHYYRIKIKCTNVLVESEDIAGKAFVIGHPTLSVLPVVLGSGAYSMTTHHNVSSPSTIITDVGREQLAKWIAGESPDRPQYIAWGDDDTAFVATQTALISEKYRSGATTNAKTTVGTVTLQSTLTASLTTGTLKEVGIFDATSAGNMWFRCVINPLTVGSTLSIRITFTFEISDETDMPNTLVTNTGLNHIRNFLYNGTTVFGYTGISNGSTVPTVYDTNLDGTVEKNAINNRLRKQYVIQVATDFATTEFNNYIMGKLGNFVT